MIALRRWHLNFFMAALKISEKSKIPVSGRERERAEKNIKNSQILVFLPDLFPRGPSPASVVAWCKGRVHTALGLPVSPTSVSKSPPKEATIWWWYLMRWNSEKKLKVWGFPSQSLRGILSSPHVPPAWSANCAARTQLATTSRIGALAQVAEVFEIWRSLAFHVFCIPKNPGAPAQSAPSAFYYQSKIPARWRTLDPKIGSAARIVASKHGWCVEEGLDS